MAKSLSIATLLSVFASSSLIAQAPTLAIDRWLGPAVPGVSIRVFAQPPANTHRAKPALEAPEPSLVPVDVLPPSLPNLPSKAVRPRPIVEPVPLSAWLGEASVLKTPRMEEAGVAVQRPSELPNMRELPTFGAYLRDRVSVVDSNWEASMVLILTPKSPERTTAVPFEAYRLPDPFPNAGASRLPSWAERETLPSFVSPPTGR